MLKWAKGSKNGGHGSGHPTARVSLADLRRASAKLLRRKDSSSSKSNKNPSPSVAMNADGSPPPPLVPPRGSSSSTYGGSVGTPTSRVMSSGVIKQATVRRMSTLRQARSQSPAEDAIKRPSSSSSSCTTTSSSSGRASRRVDTGDNGSSLYMQLDKIPVAVQQTSSQSSSAYMAAVNLKRKALEDISNQAYRHIIHSLQDELAQMSSDAEGEAAGDNETRTLAEATLLPMNRQLIHCFYIFIKIVINFVCRNGNYAEFRS